VQPQAGTCTDFIKNGTETDVDCGGMYCPACGVGRFCAINTDCASQSCVSGHCTLPTFTPPPTADVYLIQTGAGIVITPGTQAGYGITSGGNGSFRLVWTGDGTSTGQYREFFGSVVTDGTFVSITPGCGGQCSTDPGDYISQPYSVAGGQRVDFDSFNVNNLDGFDFVVTGGALGNGEPAYFDLYIDGVYHPELVDFPSGGAQSSPQVIPFGLRSQ
jgi:hypothetical protein